MEDNVDIIEKMFSTFSVLNNMLREVLAMNGKMVKRGLVSLGLSAMLFVGALPAFAGTSWKPFSTDLPRYQSWEDLKSDRKINRSDAEAKISYIGSDYKANLRIQDEGTKVSGTYKDIDEGETATFTVDSSAVGKDVTLRGQTANWTVVRVEISGKFRADS